jgi:hypothetical protein
MRKMRSTKQIFQKAVTDAFLKQPNIELNSDTMSDAIKYQQDMKEEDKIESKEATSSASSGAYSAPLFTKEETKENKLKGGLSDGMSLMDIAKKHTKDKMAKTQSPERVKKMYDHLTKQLTKGIQVEKEHTKDSNLAREIAMDHLAEDPNYYVKLKRIEESKEEAKEATTTASTGAYSTPAFIAKGSKNWRGGKKPIYKGGKFVKIKKKCLTFPYCNQGAGAIDLSEIDSKQHILKNASQRLGLSESTIIKILKKIQDKKK